MSRQELTARQPFDGDPRRLLRTSDDGDDPRPRYVVWELTLKCNLACRHCGSRAGKARPDELSTAECLDVVRQLAEVGVREVTLIGGEAYLRPDWAEIAAEITRLGMGCSLTTGGLGFGERRLAQAVEAGVRSISVSLDGLRDTHDTQRGVPGSWKSALETSRRIADSPIRLTTNTQINRLSMPELPALADLLGEIGSSGWQIQLTVAMGRAADRPELLLQPYELLELFPLLAWIVEEKLTPRGIRLFPGNNVGYFGPWEERLRYGGDQGSHYGSCSAGKHSLGLEADGTIKGCPSLPGSDYGGGTVRERALADVVANAPGLRAVRERTVDDLWGFCRSCYYADACMGGCTWTSHMLLGRPGNNPYCIHRATKLEKRGLRERVQKVEDAPGVPFDRGRYELVTEPVPEHAEPSIVGVPVADVVALQPGSSGARSRADARDTIRKRRVGRR